MQSNADRVGMERDPVVQAHLVAIETMIADGWILTSRDRKRGLIRLNSKGGLQMRSTAEGRAAVEDARQRRAAEGS